MERAGGPRPAAGPATAGKSNPVVPRFGILPVCLAGRGKYSESRASPACCPSSCRAMHG